jgi:hypothetical protein
LWAERSQKASPRRWSVRFFVTPLSCENLTRTACFITAIDARNKPATPTRRL